MPSRAVHSGQRFSSNNYCLLAHLLVGPLRYVRELPVTLLLRFRVRSAAAPVGASAGAGARAGGVVEHVCRRCFQQPEPLLNSLMGNKTRKRSGRTRLFQGDCCIHTDPPRTFSSYWHKIRTKSKTYNTIRIYISCIIHVCLFRGHVLNVRVLLFLQKCRTNSSYLSGEVVRGIDMCFMDSRVVR